MESKCIRLCPEAVRLPKRERNSYKSSYGKLLILGGAVGYTGAVSLCARSAVRSGAGLVRVGVPAEIYPIVAVKLDEPMPFPIERPLAYEAVAEKLQGSTVCVIGPGMGRREDTVAFVQDVLRHSRVPTVVDADGLFAVHNQLDLLRGTVITPHAGEFGRLGGWVTGEPVTDAKAFADAHGCTVVLKGMETVVAFPQGKVYVCPVGNPGMATGGSGDVLAGIIGSLLGQLPYEQAVLYGVLLHGAAGDRCAEELGEYAMTPSDMIEALPDVMKEKTER